ncbi:dTDP-4-dehydrorhamnose 3,5-epimerase [Aquimarina sp. 2201CG1-2-11]|uniref:dTDP-4-dehydrorhamnose 3,5-epimerase n=1 Tax=Aquimarina discodermiae TaxID=3231043 RepID=UPI003461BDB0
MKIIQTPLQDCFSIIPRVFEDERGTFFESFTKKAFEEVSGLKIHFVQDNQSASRRGVLRGLHFQTGEYAQTKLVRVVQGEVLDVVVDLRPGSKTFRKHFSIVLNDKNNTQLFVPRGFAHGYITLSKNAIFAYKCDNYYHKESESGIRYDDPNLSIDWKLDVSEIQLSSKDKELPFLKNLKL